MTAVLLGLIIGYTIDLCIGWPKALYARIGHPVGWLATVIGGFERRLNRGVYSNAKRFYLGAVTSLIAIGLATFLWGALSHMAKGLPLAPLWLGLLFWPLIAARSMYEHVAAIQKPLAQGDITKARHAVSMIVGRDPNSLDAAAIARASLESLGENTSDGIVAPIFWGVLFGPAGMAGYKAINTLDSMIAHRNTRYEWFGKLAARLDDLANLIPARLTGLMYASVSPNKAAHALCIMIRDARAHRSPNAGWPESALAAALGVRLSGPRIYGDRIAQEPWLNGEAPDPDAASIAKGLQLYRRLLGALMAILVIGACALHLG